MSTDIVNRPTVPCKGYDRQEWHVDCGNTLYTADYSSEDAANGLETLRPIWRCTNCGTETPMQSRKRQTLSMKRYDVLDTLKSEWAETDAKLKALIDAGKAKGGALLVHGFTFNYNVEALRNRQKPTRWELRYHASRARKDLEQAKKFVAELEA